MAGTENRWDKRYAFKMPVQVQYGKQTATLTVEDVSARGMFLRSDTPPMLRQLVKLTVTLPDRHDTITMHGMAVHLVKPDDRRGRVAGVGIQFYAVDSETQSRWSEFLQWVMRQPPEPVAPPPVPEPVRRMFPRYEVEVEVELEMRSLEELHVLYSRNISQGGMFLCTDLDLAPGKVLRIYVKHPLTDTSFALDAIVRRQDREVPGLGIEFIGIDDARREELLKFIQLGAPLP